MTRASLQSGDVGHLSARQAEIAGLIASGKSTREIAETLSLSPRTVETHVAGIFGKLGVRTRVELTAFVIRNAARERGPRDVRAPLASLVGRDNDVAAIARRLAESRVVTIVGTGGVGKTQASLRVLDAVSDSYADGSWLLELGAVSGGEYVTSAIARLFGISLAESDPLESLVRQLKDKRALLLFDNCEHLLDDVGAIVARIVKACAGISILATSREALRISAERTYRLPPLALPEDTASPAPLRANEVAKYSAIELFVERARALDDRFALTDATVPVIAEICRRLDGVPLAIELAAARITDFSPAEILARIDGHFGILQNARSDAPSRHRSMHALIDWSYENLPVDERASFRHLSIFAGSFTLEGALAIETLEGEGENEVVQRLASLIDKSLVMVERDGDSMRYRLLESTRVFARYKLAEALEYDAIAARHVRYLDKRFTALRESGDGFHTAAFYATFAAELGDIRAALDAAYARADYEPGARLLAAIGGCWTSLGIDREAISRNETFARALAGHPAVYAMLPGLVGLLFKNSRVGEAERWAQDALRAARETGDAGAIATSLQLVAATTQSKDVIEAALCESDRIANRTAEMDVWYRARRAWLDTWTQHFDRADARLRDLLARATVAGDYAFIVNLNMRLSVNEYFRGDLAAAVSCARAAERTARSFGNVSALAYQLYVEANFLCLAGDVASASVAVREALEIAAYIDPQSDDVAVFVEGVAFVRALEGDLTRAAFLSGYARAVYARTGAVLSGVRADLRARVEELLERGLDEAELATLRVRGEHVAARDAIELALS